MSRLRLSALFLASTLASYAAFLAYCRTPFPNDWYYFTSLSYVVRSIVLGYGRLPLQNPWVCGGLDILADPQNRVFSPFCLLDLTLQPQTAYLASLLAYGFAGLWGGFLLLRHLRVSESTAVVVSVLFINCSWFGLHFTGGHLVFGAMQLLPLVAFLFLRFDSAVHSLCLTAILALMILDGAIYPAIYSIFVMASLMASGYVPPGRLFKALRARPGWYVALLFAATCLATPKLIPALRAVSALRPGPDAFPMPLGLVGAALFNPVQSMAEIPQFGEFGCYVSPAAALLLILQCFRPDGTGSLRRWIAPALFWFWVGFDWFPAANPWRLFHLIPVANNVHMPSRVLIVAFFFFIVCVAFALERLKPRRRWYLAACAFLLIESFFVRNSPMLRRPVPSYDELPGPELIASTTISRTVDFAWAPSHYRSRDTGSARCISYFRPRMIQSSDSPGYRGEAYAQPPGGGTVRLLGYTPGRIELAYDLKDSAAIRMNTNALYGWRAMVGRAQTLGSGDDLLEIRPFDRVGRLVLEYRPSYLTPVLVSYGLGLLLMAILGASAWPLWYNSRR